MNSRRLIMLLPLILAGCGGAGSTPSARDTAETYLRGVYGCGPGLVEQTAAEDIVISYPVFESLFGTPAIRGRDAVKQFAERFCSRWSDMELKVHETVVEDDRVVLVWEFSATPAGAAAGETGSAAGEANPNPRESWGGISFIRLDDAGRVIEEIGEESSPGPIARVRR